MIACMIVACLAAVANARVAVNALPIGEKAASALVSTVDNHAGVEKWTREVAVDDGADAEVGGGISNADDWTEFLGVPLLGIIIHGFSSRALMITALSDLPEDRRDENSYFACISMIHKAAGVFAFDVADDGLLVQIIKNLDTGSPAAGWFMAVHNDNDADQLYPGYLRVNFHADPEQAAVWKVVIHNKREYLQIKTNRAASAHDTIGCYIAMPPNSDRGETAGYIGITPDVEKAMPVALVPFHYLGT